MLHTQNKKHKFFALFVIALVILISNMSNSQELGELRLEGQHIERLVLLRKDGHTEQFSRPEEIIRIPVGEYRLQDVRLKDGFIYSSRTSTYNWVAVTEDKPAVFKMGAPLKQALKIERQGPILMLNYELTGVGGETYAVTRSKHPIFTAFKGEKKVATGEFEFGWGGTCSYSWRVPSTVFGQLKIVPSADLGDMGPKQGEAAGFDWKWHYSAGKWIIWLALILALVGPKTNRDIRVLLILIPLAIVNLLWCIFIKYARMNSTDALEFGIAFNSMAVGVTVLWLVAHYFKRFGGAVRFLFSFVTVVIVAGLGTLAYSTEFSAEMALFLTLFAFMAFTILIAITLSRRFCRGTYRPVRFLLWLALWMLLGSFVTTSGFIIVGSIIFSSGPNSAEAILVFLFAGSIFGLFLYMLNLPFLILGFVHPFFRERFRTCLRLKSVATTMESEVSSGGMSDGQSSP